MALTRNFKETLAADLQSVRSCCTSGRPFGTAAEIAGSGLPRSGF